jgi:hypothetical protein
MNNDTLNVISSLINSSLYVYMAIFCTTSPVDSQGSRQISIANPVNTLDGAVQDSGTVYFTSCIQGSLTTPQTFLKPGMILCC